MKRRELIDVRFERIAAPLSLDATYGDKLWMPRYRDHFFLLPRKHYVPRCGHYDFKPVSPDSCPRFLLIAVDAEEASFFACPGSQIYVLYSALKKRAFAKTLQIKRVIIMAVSIFGEHGRLQHVGAA